MIPSDAVRSYVLDNYILPTRRRGQRTVQVRAGDVHKALKFSQRSALVFGALGSLKFQDECKVTLLTREGPGVGMSTTFTFEV